MREFRCDFYIEWPGLISDLALGISAALFPGMTFQPVSKYPEEDAILEKPVFGFEVRLDKSSGGKFCLELIREHEENIQYTDEEKIGQLQLAGYISSLLDAGGLKNTFKLLENRIIK